MESGGRDPSLPDANEAVKNNTDCVYFLASPLTCKKGNECEYRHSEGARMNPRDCWFWLNGNCLNPKCSFRHPPLDGFLGTPTTAHPGSAPPLTQTAMSTQAVSTHSPAIHTSNKQSIPCYYFQKGGCLKGERCPFMHDVQPSSNPVAQQTAKAATPVVEPTTALKGTSWAFENCSQQTISTRSADKPVAVSRTSTKADVKAESALTSGLYVKSSVMPSPLSNETSYTFTPDNVACSVSEITRRHQGPHLDPPNEHIHHGRDADESLRESSPGFDVLVDDECEDTNYFHVDVGDPSGHEAGNLNVTNDFDYHHSSIYSCMAQLERETECEVSEHDRYGGHDRYHHDDRRYSERTMERTAMHDKRGLHREEHPNEMDESDLRHRLLKKRKINGLLSAINTDHYGEPCQKDDQSAEKQRYQSRSSGRDHQFPHESSISKRLQGRITLPRRPLSDNPRKMPSVKERDGGNDWSRSSSLGQPLNYQGRLHDKVTQGIHEDFTTKPGNLEGHPRRDEVDPLNFAGPKSLAELKGTKSSYDGKDSLSKINITVALAQKNLRLNKALGHHEPEDSSSFEGPKPLSEILKRKREAARGNDSTSINGRENNQKVIEDNAGGPMVTTITDNQNICLMESQNGACPSASNTVVAKFTAVGKEEGQSTADGEQLLRTNHFSEVLEVEDDIPADNVEVPEVGAYDQDREFEYEIAGGTDVKAEDSEELPHPDQSSNKGEMFESEDGMLVDNVEDSEENYDQRDGEFEFDAVEGTDFRAYDDNYQKDEDDADDEDDDDDFARKIGIMFS